MAIKKISNEVYYTDGPVLELTKRDVNAIKAAAIRSALKRARICAHPSVKDPVQEMIIAMAKGVYVRPHKHRGKGESISVVEGRAEIIFFNDNGRITRRFEIGEYRSGKKFFYRMNCSQYHMLIVRSDTFVFHEASKGPFNSKVNIFAPWSPEEGDKEEIEKFIRKIKGGRR